MNRVSLTPNPQQQDGLLHADRHGPIAMHLPSPKMLVMVTPDGHVSYIDPDLQADLGRVLRDVIEVHGSPSAWDEDDKRTIVECVAEAIWARGPR